KPSQATAPITTGRDRGFFMYRMYSMPRAQGCAGAAMYWMYGQKITPAFSALPASLQVIDDCRLGFSPTHDFLSGKCRTEV
ncbi:hypothetical protein, partial [Thiolapillus sp.]